MNETQRLMIRNLLWANPDLEEIDATLSTAISHLIRPLVDKMIADHTHALGDVIRMLVADNGGFNIGGDGKSHGLQFGSDGDGYNEPESDNYWCACAGWSLNWVQPDPERTGRPDPAEVALIWRQHVLDTHPEDEDDPFTASRFVHLMSAAEEL